MEAKYLLNPFYLFKINDSQALCEQRRVISFK